MGRGCLGISTGEVGRGKERFQMAVFALFRWYVFFSSFPPPKQNEVRVRVLSQTRPRHNLRYLFLFSDTFLLLLLLLLSYLPTYLLTIPFFSPFIRSPSLSRPAIRSRRSKLCDNTHPPNLRRHCTRRRDGNVSVAQRVGLDFVATRWGAGEIS